MSKARAKTISLLLYNGELNGPMSIEDGDWGESGYLFSVPRELLSELKSNPYSKNFGVYLLLSDDKVYVGQSSDLASRISNHSINKDWWDRVIILTSTNDNFGKDDIDYLEHKLIDKLRELKAKYEYDNKKGGNPINTKDFRRAQLDNYLEEAYFLLGLIGIKIFKSQHSKHNIKKKEIEINAPEKLSKEKRQQKIEKLKKEEIAKILKAKKISINAEAFSISTLSTGKSTFWVEPKKEMLKCDWDIVLNNNISNELIYLHIKKNSIKVSENRDGQGLNLRKSNPKVLTIQINKDTFIDQVSKYDLSKFIVKKVKY